MRVAVAVWQLVAGYLLVAAPLSPVVWNDSFYEWLPSLRDVLMLVPVRFGICGIGACLLVIGAWEAAGLLAGLGRES